MISESQAKRYCKDDISKIENYSKAIADDTQIWHCHHRRETIYTREGLKEIGEYYNRPSCELIFMTPAEHMKLHSENMAEERKRNISEATKEAMNRPDVKQKQIEAMNRPEVKEKISKATKEALNRPEVKKKKSESNTRRNLGRHWYNNGTKNVFVKECPPGFTAGRMK